MKLKKTSGRASWIRIAWGALIVGVITGAFLSGYYLPTSDELTFSAERTSQSEDSDIVEEMPEPAINPTPDQPVRISFAAMGDMLAHDTIIANARSGGAYNFERYFEQIRPLYTGSDVVFCNQEGPSAGSTYGITGYPSFNAPVEFAAGLRNGAGCNVINLANNHIADKGVAALDATLDVWDGLKPYAVSGANRSATQQQRVPVFDQEGKKIAVLAFADFNNNSAAPSYAVNLYANTSLVESLFAQAQEQADLVVVSMHWGVEDSSAVSATQSAQVDRLAALGADVVIGTGPHVLQKVETVTRPDGNDMLVWYSLGNLLSSQLNVPQLIGGVAQFDIVFDQKGIRFDSLGFVPTYMHYEWTAAERNAGSLLSRKNAMIYPLKDAATPLSRSLFNTTVAEQQQYVQRILANTQVSIK